jgi:hypothetical protein
MKTLSLVAAFCLCFAGTVTAAHADECLRPIANSKHPCRKFPNGGLHTGKDTNGNDVSYPIPAHTRICAANNADPCVGITCTRFKDGDGVPWPTATWAVRNDNHWCLTRFE